jgi:intracellular septation protein
MPLPVSTNDDTDMPPSAGKRDATKNGRERMTTESDTTPTAADRHHPMLKLALELGPLMIFFFANLRGPWLVEKFPALTALGGPLFVATALFMAATILSLLVSKIVLGHLPIMPFVSGIVVLIFGSLSIYLQNETFIKMKPTIINALFGVALLGGLPSANRCSAMCSTRPSSSMPRAGASSLSAGASSSSSLPCSTKSSGVISPTISGWHSRSGGQCP